ncbi:MAG: hypothetical protein JST84_27140, partial [Acidobacteria bacterium]|nr:hypothetical protein [Acidobacteriota bacterium]
KLTLQCTSLMRRILVDIARERQAHKRGGEIRKVPLDEALLVTPDGLTDLLVLDDALTKLARSHPRASQIFEMHYFSGLQGQEIAAVLDVSAATITQELKKARLWLQRELRGAGGNEHANGSVGSNH